MPIKFCSEAYFSGLRFFNEPEISDSAPSAQSLSRRTCAQDVYDLKNPSTSAGFETANLGSRGDHGTPRPTRPTELPILFYYFYTFSCLKVLLVYLFIFLINLYLIGANSCCTMIMTYSANHEWIFVMKLTLLCRNIMEKRFIAFRARYTHLQNLYYL